MTKKLVILGAGGLARQVHDIVEAINAAALNVGSPAPFNFLGFVAEVQDDSHLLDSRGPVLGSDEILSDLLEGTEYVVGIGAGEVRKKVAARALGAGLTAATLVHPLAYIGNHGNVLGRGSIISAFASITTDVILGEHVFVDLNVTIGHDSHLESFVSVYPSSSISGNVHLGEGVTMGTGSRILPGITVGANSFLGAGTVVVKEVPGDSIVVGVPGRAFKK
jgi:sugar O-acyltransferase (sialic acid O-acetyltransferase NeuD family)